MKLFHNRSSYIFLYMHNIVFSLEIIIILIYYIYYYFYFTFIFSKILTVQLL